MKSRGSNSVRCHSAPTFLIPSAEMGKYEEVKIRRSSAPVASSTKVYDLGRKWSGGLMPLSSAGCYGPPPVTSTVQHKQNYYNPGNQRAKKVKTYSAYSVSKDCAIHGPALERSEESISRRDSFSSISTSSTERRPSSSSIGSLYSDNDMVDRWRRSSSQWNSSLSVSSSTSSSFNSTSVSENPPAVSYQSTQIINKKPSKPSFRRFASFRSSLNEILYEEDEEEELEEQKLKDTRIPFSFRQENDLIDSMGVLGLSSIIRDDMKSKQENIFLDPGLRKTSYNCHEM